MARSYGQKVPSRPKVNRNTLARIRKAVYERAGYRCIHCGWHPAEVPENYDGLHVLAEITGGHLRSLDLDHILPFKHVGKFTLENLQALCNSCNSRKGSKLDANPDD